MIEAIVGVLPLLLPIAGGVWGAVNSIRFVHEGERALLLRFEKVVRRQGKLVVKTPGFTMFIPKINRLAVIHVRTRTINLPSQVLTLKDASVLNVSAVILARVIDTADDLYHALFETSAGVNQTTNDMGLVILRRVISEKVYEDVVSNREAIDKELLDALQIEAKQWGLQIITFALSDCSPTIDTARLLQTARQSAERVTALVEASAILGTSPTALDPQLAAALVGTPLVLAIDSSSVGAQLEIGSSGQ